MMRIFSLVEQNNVNTDGPKYDWLRQQFVYIILKRHRYFSVVVVVVVEYLFANLFANLFGHL